MSYGPKVVGLRDAFLEEENFVELETDNPEVIKEWDDWKWFIDPNHSKAIQQFNQSKKDLNLTLVTRVVEASQNLLARYLAKDGVANRTRLVILMRLFVRVKELWMLDKGLGTPMGGFETVF